MKKSMRISGLLSALLLVYGSAQGAGLGKLSVQSALGQPLRAEIELLSVTKDELSGISAQLASRDLFRQARIERTGALSNLEFDVAQKPNGQPVIRITSSTPIADPFLDMLIELNWSTGRIIREYTVLLDPPSEGRAPSPAQPKAVPVASATETKTPEAVAKPPVESAAKPAPAADKPAAPSRYGPIKSGETLRSIAGRVKDADVTLEQMMAGLYMANKPAFIDSNMNLLKKGAVLQVPSAESVHRQVSPSQALRMLQNHADEWHAYRSKVAGVAGDTPDARQDKPAAAGAITPKVQDKTASPAAPKDVLQLSKGEPAAGGKQDAKTQERLQALEEELAAKARALQESHDRVAQLERAVRDMQELLQLKSQAAQQTPPPATPEAPVAAEPPPAPAEPPAAPAAPVAKPAPLPPPVTPVEEEGSWISTFLRNPIYIGGVVAALLLSGLLWMMMAGNRRRKGLNKFEDSIMTGGEFKSGAVFNTGGADATASAPANTEGSMLLTDFSRLGLGAIDTHEVDPIAEAEVYMAYGRDAQAEEILKEALDKDSSRHEIALKLLEIYAARKDPLAFETTASELYAGLGGQDTPVWQKAAEMGRSIDPDNPLYRMAQGQAFGLASDLKAEPEPAAKVELPPAATPDLDAGLDFTAEPPAAPAAEPAPAGIEDLGQADNGLDFTSSFDQAPLDEMAAQPTAELEPVDLDFGPAPVSEPAQEPEALDFDLTVPETPAEPEPIFAAEEAIEIAAPVVEESQGEPPLPELDLSDIDLNLELPAAETAAQETPIELAAPTLEPMADMDFQPAEVESEPVPAASAEPPAGVDPVLWEEVNTKLDLARAYLEMGDREGAREILQEVVQEGDDTQQSEARKLLDEAG